MMTEVSYSVTHSFPVRGDLTPELRHASLGALRSLDVTPAYRSFARPVEVCLKPSPSEPVDSAEQPRRQTANELFQAHATFVAKFLWRMGAPDDEIEDLVQDVFLVAHLRGGFVQDQAKATTWLASIAFRVWSSERRRFRRHSELADESALARAQARGPTPVEALATAESVDRARQVLEQIDESSRAVLILVDFDGVSCVDVAEAMGVPVGTVYSRLHKARKRFAKTYERLAKRGRQAPHGS
jgi:RNA polymerase sigma-70 factor (ECF subfamily)